MAERVSAMSATPLELLLSRLPDARRSGGGYLALCPAHADKSPSLSIREGRDGRCLVYCFASCSLDEILAALGLELKDLFPAGSGYQGGSHTRRSRGPAKRQLTKDEQVKAKLEEWRARRLGEVNLELSRIEDELTALTEVFSAVVVLSRHDREVPSLRTELAAFDILRNHETQLEEKISLLNSPSLAVVVELWRQEHGR